METVPKTLNWVKARAECSMAHLFMLLCETVDSDVKVAQSYDSLGQLFTNRPNESKLIVGKKSRDGMPLGGVVFEMTRTTITAWKSTNQGPQELFTAAPSFDAAGACRLRIGNETLELWQVSRRALEELFFS